MKPETKVSDMHLLNGVAYGLPSESYFSNPALNKSTLTAFAELEDQDKEESKAMIFGSLADCLLLEPDEFGKRYVITDLDRSGTKAWKAEEEAAQGRELVKRPDYDAAMLLAYSVRESEAAEFLNGAKFQASCFWVDPETGLRCKCRPDVLGTHLADLKSTHSIKPAKFAKTVFDFHYDWADAWYLEGLAANGMHYDKMVFIAVESKSKLLAGSTGRKHSVGIFEIDPEDREIARRRVSEWRRIYAYSLQTNDWPEHPKGLQTIIRPKWAIVEEE